jgi:hypothetical protein
MEITHEGTIEVRTEGTTVVMEPAQANALRHKLIGAGVRAMPQTTKVGA